MAIGVGSKNDSTKVPLGTQRTAGTYYFQYIFLLCAKNSFCDLKMVKTVQHIKSLNVGLFKIRLTRDYSILDRRNINSVLWSIWVHVYKYFCT